MTWRWAKEGAGRTCEWMSRSGRAEGSPPKSESVPIKLLGGQPGVGARPLTPRPPIHSLRAAQKWCVNFLTVCKGLVSSLSARPPLPTTGSTNNCPAMAKIPPQSRRLGGGTPPTPCLPGMWAGRRGLQAWVVVLGGEVWGEGEERGRETGAHLLVGLDSVTVLLGGLNKCEWGVPGAGSQG